MAMGTHPVPKGSVPGRGDLTELTTLHTFEAHEPWHARPAL